MKESKKIGKGFTEVFLIVPIFIFLLSGVASALSNNWNWMSFGEDAGQSGAKFGWSVSTAGDVNGDGYGDVIVGARYYDNGGGYDGRALVYYGSASGLSTTPDWTAEGQSGDQLGNSVGTAGDVNGDGYSDIIVGALYHDNHKGKVLVYYGSASGLSTTPDWTAEGETGDYLGYSVSTAGDVNGDGYSDVIVGAFNYDVLVYYGSASGLNTTPDWTAEGETGGNSVGTAGDVNGDGYSDVIIGEYLYSSGTWDEGKVLVYYGSPSGLSIIPDWTIIGDQLRASFGYSVSTAGDVNGDGYSDVIVGAYTYSNVEFQEGRAFVYYGSSSGLSTTADWTAESNHEGDYFGYSVSTAGDVNGDGYSDVIVGALFGEGRAFVYYGSELGLSTAPDWTANRTYSYFGFSVSTAGDVNNDNYSDIIVGAPNFWHVEGYEGAAFVYHGSADPTIAYSPTSFNFTAIEGGSNPSNQTLNIWNAGGGTLNWSVSDNATWLSLSPTSGTNSGTVTLTVNIAGLTEGIYNAIITITAPGASNTPVNIPVTLAIGHISASQWIRTYGGNNSDQAFSTDSVQQTSDGGYIVAGNTVSFGTGSSDFWVLKLDTNGNVLWQKTYGSSLYDYAYSIQQTSDGGYIVAGETNSFGAGNYDFLVLRLDASGNVLWQNTYGGGGNDYAYSIQQTSDGGYIVAGDTESFGAGSGDSWVLKLDANGNVLWQKTYGGNLYDHAETIQQTTDGGYIVFGETASFGTGNGDFWVFKLDASGNVLWQKTYGGSYLFNVARSIQQTSDNGYILAGMTQSFGAGSGDGWVLKLYSNGNVQWQKTYGGSDFDGAAIQQASDGGYIMVGRTASFGAGSDDVWVLKLNTNGNVLWQKTYGGSDSEITPTIRQTSDGGYIAAGMTYSFGAGNRDVLVLKLDSKGDIPGCSIAGTSNAIVTNTSATITSTSVTGINTTVSPQTSAVTVIDTTATVTEVCFSFGPEVLTLFYPDGGEIIPSGSTYTIQWSAPPEAVRFQIGYSLDNGAGGTWKLIANNVTDYTYNWTVPALDRNNNTCRVGVRAYNASDGVIGNDTSDNPFTIQIVKVTAPDGGETLTTGTTYQITWQTNATVRPVQSVKIYGSPNQGQSGTWKLLTTVPGNPGYYNWTVPQVGTPKDKCRIGIVLLDSSSINIGQDMSDNNFTIRPAP